MGTANIQELQKKAAKPANQVAGNTVADFFEANKKAIEAVAPKHMGPDRLLKIAMQAIRTTPKLKECTTKSLFGAVIQCAEMGLEPNTVLGHAYLVPFNNRREGVTDVQVIIGYRGMIDLARRSGQITSIQAHAVREQDYFDYAYGLDERLEHIPSGDEDSPITHFYAYAKFTDGGYAFEVLPRPKVDEIRNNSQGYQNAIRYKKDHPWINHYEEMGRKTAIRRLAKFLPLSVEFATAAALDGKAEAGADQDLDSVLDGTYTVTPEADDAPEEVAPEGEEGQEQENAEPPEDPGFSADDVINAIQAAQDLDQLDEALSMGQDLSGGDKQRVTKAYNKRRTELTGSGAGETTETQGAEAQGEWDME